MRASQFDCTTFALQMANISFKPTAKSRAACDPPAQAGGMGWAQPSPPPTLQLQPLFPSVHSMQIRCCFLLKIYNFSRAKGKKKIVEENILFAHKFRLNCFSSSSILADCLSGTSVRQLRAFNALATRCVYVMAINISAAHTVQVCLQVAIQTVPRAYIYWKYWQFSVKY